MKDFNIRAASEAGFDTSPVIEDSLALFLQELDVLFSTDRNEILGDVMVGQNLESLLWKTTFNSNRIESELSDSVRAFCFMNEFFEWTIKVSLVKGATRDIAVVDVDITNEAITPTSIQYIFK